MAATVKAAMSEPGFQEWLDARETKNEGSLRSMATHFGIARVFASANGFGGKPFLEMTKAEAASLGRKMKTKGFSVSILASVRSFYRDNEMMGHAKAFKMKQKVI